MTGRTTRSGSLAAPDIPMWADPLYRKKKEDGYLRACSCTPTSCHIHRVRGKNGVGSRCRTSWRKSGQTSSNFRVWPRYIVYDIFLSLQESHDFLADKDFSYPRSSGMTFLLGKSGTRPWWAWLLRKNRHTAGNPVRTLEYPAVDQGIETGTRLRLRTRKRSNAKSDQPQHLLCEWKDHGSISWTPPEKQFPVGHRVHCTPSTPRVVVCAWPEWK